MMKAVLLTALVAFAASEMTMEEMIRRLGTKTDGKDHSPDAALFQHDGASLPAKFISGVDKWTECNGTIFEIKNQAQCGSCWAVAASEVLEDRWCISCPVPTVNGKKKTLWFAAEYLLSCCSYCGDGCEGGYPIDAMRWFQYKGIPTGGPYGSGCGCQPYQVKPGAPDTGRTPPCRSECDTGYPISLKADLHRTSDHYKIDASVSAIQQAILKGGPVECAFDVYESFYSWFKDPSTKTKVYKQNRGRLLGGHAIKIIGWDTDSDGTDYWLINNSWGTDWGMGGQFKYVRGTDLGGMEDGCVAADPKCTNTNDYSNEYYCRGN